MAIAVDEKPGPIRVQPVEPYDPPPPPDAPSYQKEYVAGGNWSIFYGKTAQTLPHPIDDVSTDFGDDIYDRMVHDPQVAACTTIFKASILETGPAITPPITDKDDPEYDKAKEICDQALRMLSDIESSFNEALWNLFDSVYLGNKVAEMTYGYGAAIKTGKRISLLEKFKIKERRATLFAVDAYNNIVGMLVRTPSNFTPIAGQILYEDTGKQNRFLLVPKEKFVISTFRKKDEDPRGTSILRAAYSPWWRKQQVIPEYLKYLTQFAGPSLVGKVAEGAVDVPDPTDATGQKTLSPQQVMLAAMQAFRNGTAIAIDNGAEIDPLQMTGDGTPFLRSIQESDQQITKAILTQELATEEGKHMARAAAEVHQDVLETLVRQGKLSAQDCLRKQLLRRWVIMNWGDALAHLAPIADFGATEQRNKPGLWQGAAALMNSQYFSKDQLQELDKMIGVPIRQGATALAFDNAEAKAAPKPEEPPPVDENRVAVKPHTRNKPLKPTPQDEQDNEEKPGDKQP